jgi:hypothetical protein
MIDFHLTSGTNGSTIATHEGQTARGHDPCRTIARDLVEAGTPDQPWRMLRDGKLAMSGKSLHWLAATVLSETDRGFQRAWWKQHPNASPRPVLAAIVAEQKARRA